MYLPTSNTYMIRLLCTRTVTGPGSEAQEGKQSDKVIGDIITRYSDGHFTYRSPLFTSRSAFDVEGVKGIRVRQRRNSELWPGQVTQHEAPDRRPEVCDELHGGFPPRILFFRSEFEETI
jgi:hypothetical protein